MDKPQQLTLKAEFHQRNGMLCLWCVYRDIVTFEFLKCNGKLNAYLRNAVGTLP